MKESYDDPYGLKNSVNIKSSFERQPHKRDLTPSRQFDVSDINRVDRQSLA